MFALKPLGMNVGRGPGELFIIDSIDDDDGDDDDDNKDENDDDDEDFKRVEEKTAREIKLHLRDHFCSSIYQN